MTKTDGFTPVEREIVLKAVDAAHGAERGYMHLFRMIVGQLRQPFDQWESESEMNQRRELRIRVEGIADYAERQGI